MKTVIAALNSQYIHASLAPWYLKAACGDECGALKVIESTINENIDIVFKRIYKEKPDVIAFSCYIWNITYVTAIIGNIKQVLPNVKIILGGPEVSYDAELFLKDSPEADYIIMGEGETAFKALLKHIKGGDGQKLCADGIVYRSGDRIISMGGYNIIEDLDTLPSPYTDEMLCALGNRIVYFESSRGCPFSCSYCLSSTFNGVRYFSLNRTLSEMDRLVKAGVKQIKFVDRTFNCSRERSKAIFRWILENGGDTNFHFEAAADLFDKEMLDILHNMPDGRVQLEIGIQTANEEALDLIKRKTDLEIVFRNIAALREKNNINIHVDLIAGLPAENYNSFKQSFDYAYKLRPHQLQLGFLKLLKGSGIRSESEKFGYKFRSYPPYEFLFNKYITADEVFELKDMEEVLERYYNSGRFVKTLEYLCSTIYASSFEFYNSFARYNREKGLLDSSMASRSLYSVLIDFLSETQAKEDIKVINEFLKYDYLASDNTANIPSGIERQIEEGFREKCFEFLKDEGNIDKYLPEYKGKQPREIVKKVHFETFAADIFEDYQHIDVKGGKTVVLYDYSMKSRVTGLYKANKLL